MTPNPLPVEAVQEPARVRRRVLCLHYGDCLDLAVQRRWDGFTCGECRAYRSIARCPESWIEDALACRALLRAMGFS